MYYDILWKNWTKRGVHVAVSGQRGLKLIPAPNAMLTKNQHERSLNLLAHTKL